MRPPLDSSAPSRCALLALLLAGLTGCDRGEDATHASALFTRVDPEASGVTFANTIEETMEVNVLTFEYLYNGGGVGVGDVTGDGLSDLFFVSTQGPERLYRNLGTSGSRT